MDQPFPIDARLTAIALAYRNLDITLIAESVMPRTPTAKKFTWRSYAAEQGFTVPNTSVGRKSYPTEVEFGATEHTDSTQDYALDDFVPQADQTDDNAGVDPRGMAVAGLVNLITLGREIRVANTAFSAGSYAPANILTMAPGGQLSDAAVDPNEVIEDMLDKPFYRPNVAIFGQRTWSRLRRNKKLVQAIKGTNQEAGMVSRAEFAEHFEIGEVLVGAGRFNVAAKGQPMNLQRVWGNHAAFIYRDRQAGPQSGMTWGFTAEHMSRFVRPIPDGKRGIEGGETIRVGERLKELVVAKDLGCFIQNAVA
jgi:hypothetical protein